jgi:hypothetical protein
VNGINSDVWGSITQHVTRSYLTIALVTTLCYGFLVGQVSVEAFVPVVAGSVGFWFGQRGAESRATDRLGGPSMPGAATATAPAAGGTATATVTPSQP